MMALVAPSNSMILQHLDLVHVKQILCPAPVVPLEKVK